MPDLPHILIFEPEATGHQMEYLRHLLAAIERDVPLTRVTLLTTAEASDHPNTRRLAQDFSQFVPLRIAPQTTAATGFFARFGVLRTSVAVFRKPHTSAGRNWRQQ